MHQALESSNVLEGLLSWHVTGCLLCAGHQDGAVNEDLP